ncbi:hypothetical protein CSIM01_04212 [Colletotrichum simmondsii]|uniref:Uncharacterized protein n=1 Tax=Colletotrichum simmondsii TaxID=703756 RepID=A0A135RP34_9PEZI|nr:hypothetical protein CSIM01_04212 [Colletotrichum simmondsii]
MEDHVTHFLLDLDDMKITSNVTPEELWQAGGGRNLKIYVIEAHEFELASSDLGISFEANVEDLDIFGHRISAHPTKAIGARGLAAPEGCVCIPAAADATAVTHDPAAGSRSGSKEICRKLGPSTYFYF